MTEKTRVIGKGFREGTYTLPIIINPVSYKTDTLGAVHNPIARLTCEPPARLASRSSLNKDAARGKASVIYELTGHTHLPNGVLMRSFPFPNISVFVYSLDLPPSFISFRSL